MGRAGVLVAATLLAGRVQALEFVPVFNANLMGGQYFFQGDRSSLSGNGGVVIAPTFRDGDRWSYIPMYAANYRGTKGVGESVGSGTLFQQSMDHRVSFTAVHNPAGTPWRLKPSVSYKREFLKETRDEAWGDGLFDFEKVAVGFEAENMYKEPFSWRTGLDVFHIRFPQYSSLESKSGVDPNGNPLGRELASAKVLDTWNFSASASGTRPVPFDEPKFVLSGSVSSTYQLYDDQRLVDFRGQFNDHKPYGRQDFLQALSGSIGFPRPVRWFGSDFRLDTTFGVNFAYNGSNQNTFDASRTTFVPDAYSYFSWGLGPGATLSWGETKRPAWVGMSLRYSRTQYLGRLAQDGDGLYTADHQRQDRTLASLSYSYPIAPGFNLKAQTNFLWARSNQNYEKTYQYNYRTANYLLGFTYEY